MNTLIGVSRPQRLQSWIATNFPSNLRPLVGESWKAYLSTHGGTGSAFHELERSFLTAAGYTTGHVQSRWSQLFAAAGFTGGVFEDQMRAYFNALVFTPASVANMAVWYDASAITGLTDGQKVASWTDMSGGGFTLTQATGASQPTYKTNILNSLPVVRFDGVDDTLANAAFVGNASTQTIFIAMTNRSGTNGSNYSTNNSAGPLQRSGNFWYDGNASSMSGGVTNGGPVLITLLYDYLGDVYTVRRNGSQQSTTTTAGSFAGATLNIGSRQATEFLTADLAEFIMYSSVLNATDYANVENYLKMKWNLY